MKLHKSLVLGLAVCSWAFFAASPIRATLRDAVGLSGPVQQGDEWIVALNVDNSRDLAALDIPIRFGKPGQAIELVRVDFAESVSDWDFKYAQIDNQTKTVILGLISELVGTRPQADLRVSSGEPTRLADLVFRLDESAQPEFSVFTTSDPGHDLTFLYNEQVDGRPQVREFRPAFESTVDFRESTLPRAYGLSQAYPNPFNPTTSFTLSLPAASDYSVRVFNVAGQTVRTWEGHLDAGEHRLTWDGRSAQGQPVASGTYFFQAQAGGFNQIRTMTLLK